MTTIADVAREAGVSVSTVSHVINGTRRVSPATASAVKAVIDAHRLSPQRRRAVVEDGFDPLSRHRHIGNRQSLLHRYHLRDRDRMRPAWHDDLPLGHPGRPDPRASGPDRAASAPGRRRHSGARAPTPSAARSPICRRRACRACWSTARPIPRSIRSASTIARRCATSSAMSPGSGIAASAMSAAIPVSRRRSSASSATAILLRGWVSRSTTAISSMAPPRPRARRRRPRRCCRCAIRRRRS